MSITFQGTTYFKKRILLILFPVILCFGTSGFAQPDAHSYFARGESFFNDKLFDSAFVNYERAVRFFRAKESRPEMINAMNMSALSLIRLKKNDRAISMLLPERQTADKLQDTSKIREKFYETLSDAYYYAGDAFNSLDYFNEVYKINISRGNTPTERMLYILRSMGVLSGNVGNLQNAVDHYSAYASLIRKAHGEDHMFMSDAYNYLGVMYRHRGEYDLALDYYKKSIAIAERYTPDERAAIAPRFRSIANVYNNIGVVYHVLKDHENALAYTLKALELHQLDKSANTVALAAIYSSLGTTYTVLDRHEEAMVHKQKAKAMYIDVYGKNHGRVATELKNIGDSYFEIKNYVAAEKYYQESLDMNLRVHGNFHPNTAEAYIKLASIREVQGEIKEALQLVQTGIGCLVQDFDNNSVFENPELSSLCHARILLTERLTKKADLLVKLFEKDNDTATLRSAHDTYARAVAFSEVVRNDLVDSRSKLYLAENSKSLFEKNMFTAVTLYAITNDSKYLDAAFALMEKNKSRLLLESLQFSQLKNALDLPADLFNQENSLKSQVSWYEERILAERVKGDAKDSLKIVKDQEGLFETRRKLESLIQQLQREYPKYHLAKYSIASITPSDLQKTLSKDALLLEFFSGDSAMYIFYATSQDKGIIRVDVSVNSDIGQMVNSVRSRNMEIYSETAYSVYSQILEPVFKMLSTPPQKIIIVADGIVAYMPFELLLTQPAASNRYKHFPYAIKKFNFSYRLSSALMFNDFKDGQPERGEIFTGFAPHFDGAVVAQRDLPGNIPYAQREVRQISNTFPGEIFIGSDATESKFRTLAERSGVIHLATHAAIDGHDANFSKLYFASTDSLDDGMLHAFEIFNLRMSAELVTLSACNTGLGVYREGEGVMSLSRAFAYAGCESIVTSLWPSQDQTTADIMANFYQNLATGMDKDDALRQAKLKFLETSDNIKSDPFYWAGFVLIGDPAPLKTEMNIMAVLMAVFAAIILVGAGLMYWKKKRFVTLTS